MYIWVREGRLEKVVAFSKGEVSRKRAFWRHTVASKMGLQELAATLSTAWVGLLASLNVHSEPFGVF